MNWKFWSAGRIICSRQTFLILFALSLLLSCRQQTKGKDPQIDQLQRDFKQLSSENQRLLKEVQTLREEMRQRQAPHSAPESQTAQQTTELMSVDQMKKEVGLILKDAIERIKKSSETPKGENKFGMRVEYDLKNAVYGLVNNNDPSAPYSAKVIVKFEKFLESGNVSRSYGNGSSTFVFAYRNKQWILQSYE